MTTAEAKKAEPAKSEGPLSKAGERIRESAKWLIVSFAAVGAILAAGLQIANIGELRGLRLTWAIGGLAAVILGVVIAIRAAGGVVTQSFVSLGWLSQQASDHPAMDGVEGDRGLLGGFESVDALKTAYDDAVAERKAALTNYYKDPTNEEKRLKADAAQKWVRALDQSQIHVIERASFSKLSDAYKKAGIAIAFGAVLVAVGITAFGWGANPPEEEMAPIVIPAATEVVVNVDEEDRAELQEILGANCDLSAVQGVAVEAIGETYRVASVATPECESALFTVSRNVGQVLPASLLEPEDPGSGDTG
jgi:hypothetical protein